MVLKTPNPQETIVFYDKETTGFPDWKQPSDGLDQPHIVQLAAIKCDPVSREPLASIDLIIRPDGWVIPEDATAIHGITNEQAQRFGVSEGLAIRMLLDFCHGSLRVAHNRTFDQRIGRIAAKRFLCDEKIERWARKDDHECTMVASKSIPGIGGSSLPHVYQFLTGEELENAHTAMGDAIGCMHVYWGIQDYHRGDLTEAEEHSAQVMNDRRP